MVRPFRFGVASVETASGSAWTEFARRAEALGYATLVVPDHYLNPLPPAPATAASAEGKLGRSATIPSSGVIWLSSSAGGGAA